MCANQTIQEATEKMDDIDPKADVADNEIQNKENNEQKDKKSDEHQRLGGHSPLKTILMLCPGPLISQIVTALYGVVDSIWVSRFIGEIGLTALSIAFVIDNTALAFGMFMSIATATKISHLISQNKYSTINQVIVDLLRICLIIGCFVPAILFPASKPLFKFLGADAHISSMSFNYVTPLLALNFITCTYQCLCGALQSEGRTWTYAIAQVSSMILNMACWDPLLLYFTRKPMGSSLATEIAMFLPSCVIMFLLFRGKFAAKPQIPMYCKKFDKETWEAIKIGISALIMNLSYIIPSLVSMKFISIRAQWVGEYESVIAVFSSIARVYPLTFCFPFALVTSYLPACSYAFGRKDLKRVLMLTWTVVYICIIYGAIITVVMVVFGKQIGSIFSNGDSFLKWSKVMYPPCFYAFICSSLKFILIAFLQATQQNIKSIIVSIITEICSSPIYSCIFHYATKDKSPVTVLYAYCSNDATAALVCSCFAAPFLIHCWKNRNNPPEDPEKQTELDNEEDSEPKVMPEL